MKITCTPARKDSDPEEMGGHRVWRDTSEAASTTIELTRAEAIAKLVAWATEHPNSFFKNFDLDAEFNWWAHSHRASFDRNFPGIEHVEPEDITVTITQQSPNKQKGITQCKKSSQYSNATMTGTA